jgi:amidohydrolase
MLPSLKKVAGEENVIQIKAETIGEDFSYFQEVVPGFYFYLGGMTKGNTKVFSHHTPDFFIDENGLLLGVKAFTQITFDFLNN